jgi:hypothetical protein
MALALAASTAISVSSTMSFLRSAAALIALGCADPRTLVQSTAPDVSVQQKSEVASSYSVGGADRTIYVRFAAPRGESGEPVYEFLRRVFASADSAGTERLVVDLRSVSGSDARLLVPLIRGIVTRDRFARSGGLYVVVGASSYTASQNAATLLARYAQPLFVSDAPAR